MIRSAGSPAARPASAARDAEAGRPPSVRVAELSLDYGCHVRRAIRFGAEGGPAVVYGPNGSGKSTLLEALVRVLFGFNRRLPGERERQDARTPWTAASFEGRLVLRSGRERWELHRDFATDRVTLTPLEGDAAPWRGDGNPGSSNSEAKEYRRRLRRLFGFANREAYEATACIHQGELLGTRLNDDLLQLAAGGHGNVDTALTALRERHRGLTVRPVAPGAGEARNPRELEEARQALAELERQLQAAEEATRRRRPIRLRIEALGARRESLRAEVARLEAAQEPLAERRALRAEAATLAARRRALTAARRKVAEARRRLERARETAEEAVRDHPADFPERVSRLETFWRQRQELEARRQEAERVGAGLRTPPAARAAGASGVTALAVAAVARAFGTPEFLTGALPAGLLAALGVLLLAGAALGWDRARAERQRRRAAAAEAAEGLASLRREIERTLRGVPNAESLRPSNARERLERFERGRRAEEALGEAEVRLRSALDEAQEALARPEPGVAEGRDPHAAAAAALERLERAEDDLRKEEAKKEIQLERGEAERLELPDGVAAEAEAVRRALAERRTALEETGRELRREERALLEEGAPAESPVALRDRREEGAARVASLEREVRILEAAYALVRDAYASFRERDEERLVAHVSRRMADLSGGALGPVEPGRALADATVRLNGRSVPLGCPPLSFGEYHAALLGIRLGATDFLSAAGIRPPLIVDDPFVHLDEGRAASLWAVLERVSEERQVIVATQDRLLLDHLGIEPAVRLES